MSKVLIGIILSLVLAFGTYYWFSSKKIERLTENNAKLSVVAKTNEETINRLNEDNQSFQRANDELQVKLKASEAYGDELGKKLRKHNLTLLTLKKPGLIEKRVNDATQKIFETNCFRSKRLTKGSGNEFPAQGVIPRKLLRVLAGIAKVSCARESSLEATS